MNQAELTPLPLAEKLAALVRQSQNWAEVETVIASFPEQKAEVWQLLDDAEKSRIKQLKHRPVALPLSLVGRRVFVTAGKYRSGGEGVVEVDRGVGTLRMVEVKMSNKKIQITSIDNIQLLEW